MDEWLSAWDIDAVLSHRYGLVFRKMHRCRASDPGKRTGVLSSGGVIAVSGVCGAVFSILRCQYE